MMVDDALDQEALMPSPHGLFYYGERPYQDVFWLTCYVTCLVLTFTGGAFAALSP